MHPEQHSIAPGVLPRRRASMPAGRPTTFSVDSTGRFDGVVERDNSSVNTPGGPSHDLRAQAHLSLSRTKKERQGMQTGTDNIEALLDGLLHSRFREPLTCQRATRFSSPKPDPVQPILRWMSACRQSGSSISTYVILPCRTLVFSVVCRTLSRVLEHGCIFTLQRSITIPPFYIVQPSSPSPSGISVRMLAHQKKWNWTIGHFSLVCWLALGSFREKTWDSTNGQYCPIIPLLGSSPACPPTQSTKHFVSAVLFELANRDLNRLHTSTETAVQALFLLHTYICDTSLGRWSRDFVARAVMMSHEVGLNRVLPPMIDPEINYGAEEAMRRAILYLYVFFADV